jgi:hypothetical protein
MAHLQQHVRERHAPPNGRLLRKHNGQPITHRRYDYLWERLSQHLPWVASQQISTHWLRHTTLTWVNATSASPSPAPTPGTPTPTTRPPPRPTSRRNSTRSSSRWQPSPANPTRSPRKATYESWRVTTGSVPCPASSNPGRGTRRPRRLLPTQWAPLHGERRLADAGRSGDRRDGAPNWIDAERRVSGTACVGKPNPGI